MKNDNTREALEKTTQMLLQQLSQLEHAPSVQIQTGQPGTRCNPDAFGMHDDSEDDADPDEHAPFVKRCHLAEFFDTDEREQQHDRMDAGRLGIHDYEEPPSDDDDGF